jgi:hypothetical protein
LPDKEREVGPSAYILAKLLHFGIDTQEKLNGLIERRLSEVLKEDHQFALRGIGRINVGDLPEEKRLKFEKGFYFSKAALVNWMLRLELGHEKWKKYQWKDFLTSGSHK